MSASLPLSTMLLDQPTHLPLLEQRTELCIPDLALGDFCAADMCEPRGRRLPIRRRGLSPTCPPVSWARRQQKGPDQGRPLIQELAGEGEGAMSANNGGEGQGEPGVGGDEPEEHIGKGAGTSDVGDGVGGKEDGESQETAPLAKVAWCRCVKRLLRDTGSAQGAAVHFTGIEYGWWQEASVR